MVIISHSLFYKQIMSFLKGIQVAATCRRNLSSANKVLGRRLLAGATLGLVVLIALPRRRRSEDLLPAPHVAGTQARAATATDKGEQTSVNVRDGLHHLATNSVASIAGAVHPLLEHALIPRARLLGGGHIGPAGVLATLAIPCLDGHCFLLVVLLRINYKYYTIGHQIFQ